MLEENKQIYTESANRIEGWKHLTISELANQYLIYKQADNLKYENYLSAIICKLWHNISHYYYKYHTIPIEECYNQIIEAILYTLNTHVWTDPNNKLYHDPKGPEKALNVCISSRILAFFVSSNRDKRKLNYNNIYSIQELSEEDHDERCLEYHDTYNFQEAFIDSQIKEIFEHKDYLKAFVLDSIVNKNCFDYDETTNETNFSLKKLKHQIRSLNTEYCEIFSHRYNLDPLKVEKSLDYVLNISYTNMDSKLNQVMTNLKYDRKFLNELRGF